MRIYTVHVLPGSYRAGGRDPVVLREGFCWTAAIFSVFWALAYRLWWTAFGLLVAAAALAVLADFAGLDQTTRLAAFAGYAVLVGYFANDWRRAALERAGWRIAGVVAAPGEDAALRRYFDLAVDAAPTPARSLP